MKSEAEIKDKIIQLEYSLKHKLIHHRQIKDVKNMIELLEWVLEK
jgi:hypothetical protein